MTLLADLKDRLNVAWNENDPALTNIIERSKSYLLELTGATFAFDEEDSVKELLLERCRYVYNNAADEFEINFSQELKRLILQVAVDKAVTVSEEDT